MMFYSAGFDRAALTGLGTLVLNNGVQPIINVNLDAIVGDDGSSTKFFHYGFTLGGFSYPSVFSEDSYQEVRDIGWNGGLWSVAVTTEIQAQATANGWPSPGNLAAVFDNDTVRYTIGYVSGGVVLSATWSTSAGRALFGFASNPGGATSHTGTRTPTYVLRPQQRYVANTTPNREADAIGSTAVNAAGNAFTVSRPRPVFERDWRQPWEPKARVLAEEADTTDPWTHQHLREHCRSLGAPFIVHDGGFGRSATAEVFRLRGDGLSFEPEYSADQHPERYHVHYRTWVAGRIAFVS